MRGRDKLLEPVDGLPLLRVLGKRLSESAIDQLVCVLPPDGDARRNALDGIAADLIVNARASDGMGTSIAAGVAALGTDIDAALIVLGDMPEIVSNDIDRLLAAFDPGEDRAIVRATGPDGVPGQPVLFGRRFFEALRGLEGDAGARQILAEHPEFIADVSLSGSSALLDLDTPEAWDSWRAGNAVSG